MPSISPAADLAQSEKQTHKSHKCSRVHASSNAFGSILTVFSYCGFSWQIQSVLFVTFSFCFTWILAPTFIFRLKMARVSCIAHERWFFFAIILKNTKGRLHICNTSVYYIVKQAFFDTRNNNEYFISISIFVQGRSHIVDKNRSKKLMFFLECDWYLKFY